MTRVSNGVITGLNILTLIIACAVIGCSLWFTVKLESPCQKVLKTPMLIIGVALLAVSLAGLIGSCCTVSVFMVMYLVVLLIVVLGLFVFTIFTMVVTNKGFGKALSNRGVGEHRLGDYSRWLQNYVINDENWEEIKSCLVGVRLCQMIADGKGEAYYKSKLSPIQSGCCKPPNYCGMEFHNATYWTMLETGPVVPHPDCMTWSNKQKELCFECESCKAQVLNNIKREWRTLALINVCIIIFVIVIYSVGCCAFRNNRSNGYIKYRPGNP